MMRAIVTAWSIASLAVLAVSSRSSAEELLPPDVDHYVDANLRLLKTEPAPRAADSVLLRRLTLDLAGRIPTANEARAYLESTAPDKRQRLVDRLMGSPSFQRHQVNVLDAMLMDGTGGSVRSYLEEAVQENRGWDQVFRQLVMPQQVKDPSPAQKAATEFIKRRVGDLDNLTNEASVLFFGVNVSCAKCHDHPLVYDWTQDHFYGMKSFFNRTFDNGDFLGERDYGMVSYKTTSGESRMAKLMFLSGAVLDEPESEKPSKDAEKKEKEQLEEYKKKKIPPPAPAFSRRAQLVDVALRGKEQEQGKEQESSFFARSAVNRLFHRLTGQGLVMPLDQMHSGNPPSHPELLDWLARDFRQHGYDLPRMIRGIVLSETYARSSRWEESSERPNADLFAVANVRPLAPEPLGVALRLATTDPEQFPADLKQDEFEKRIEGIEKGGLSLARLFERPGRNFQVSVTEALLFSNDERIERDLLSSGGGRLVNRLVQIEDDEDLVQTAIWTVLSRPPDKEETELLTSYLAERKDRRVEACQQIVWALLTSSEFRFNY